MMKKIPTFFIAATLALSLSAAHAKVTNSQEGMAHIIQLNGRLAMIYNTDDKTFPPALKSATEAINNANVGQSKDVHFNKTVVNLKVLEEYKDDTGLPCKKAFMTRQKEGTAYYIYVCNQEDGSDQVTLQSDLQSVLRQR